MREFCCFTRLHITCSEDYKNSSVQLFLLASLYFVSLGTLFFFSLLMSKYRKYNRKYYSAKA